MNDMKYKIVKYVFMLTVIMLLLSCGKELSNSERLQQARVLLAANQYKESVIELKKVLRSEPKNKSARYLLATIYIVLGDGVSAEKELTWAKKLGITHSKLVVPLGRSLILQYKYAEALAVLQIADVDSSSDKSVVLSLRGNAYFEMAEIKQAKKAFIGAMALDENNSAALIGMSKIALEKGRYVDADKYLKRAGKTKASQNEVWIIRARMHQLRGEYIKAEELFKAALNDKGRIVTKLQYDAMVGLINVQVPQGKLDEAGVNIDKLTKVLPRHPYPKYLRAWHAYQKKNYVLANTLLLELQKDLPDNTPGLLLFGATKYALGNYEQASIYLSRFVNQVPTHVQGRKLLGAVRLKLNQPEKALETLRSVVKENNADSSLLVMVGMAAGSLGKSEMQLHYLKKAVKSDPGSIQLRTELARIYMQKGEFDEAIAELKRAQKIDGGQSQAALLIIYAHIRANKYKEAKELVNELIQQSPRNPKLFTLLGGINLLAGNRGLARGNFSKALGFDNDFIPARFNLARMELEDGNLSNAGKEFDRILLNDGKAVKAMIGHAQIAEQRGNAENVILWLEKARDTDAQTLIPRIILAKYYLKNGKTDLALKISKEIYSITPNTMSSSLLLGRAQLLSGNRAAAVNTFEKLVKNIPDNPVVLLALADARFANNDEKGGRNALNKALLIKPDLIAGRIGLIRLELRAGDIKSALTEAKKIQKYHSKASIGYIMEGDIFARLYKYKEAKYAYKQAMKIQPSVEATIKLAQTHAALGEQNKSINVLLVALKKYPDDLQLKIMLGIKYQKNGNTQLAEKYYIQVIAQQPLNIMVLNNLANLYAEKMPAKAVKYAQQAYQQAPDNIAIADTLAWLLVLNGSATEGLVILERISLKNKNPVIRYHYAVALEKTGQLLSATKVLRQLLASEIKFDERKRARQLLQKLQNQNTKINITN